MKTTPRKIRLEMETLEDRLVPALASIQLAGSTLIVQGASTPDRVVVLEQHGKITVEATDLAKGTTLQESFKKDKIRTIELRQGSSGKDVFDNEIRDRKITVETFDKNGIEIGVAGAASASHGSDDRGGQGRHGGRDS
jgi:hypothetical protein